MVLESSIWGIDVEDNWAVWYVDIEVNNNIKVEVDLDGDGGGGATKTNRNTDLPPPWQLYPGG